MTLADLLLVAWVLLFSAAGFFRGLAAQAVSLAGLALGALVGSWAGPQFLSAGQRSPWVPLASLLGAAAGALVLGVAVGSVAGRAHRFFADRPPLDLADRVGGAAAGAALGLALAWLVAVLFLQQPALGLRRAVQTSALFPALLRAIPPEPVLRALNRFDPFPLLPALAPRRLPPPDRSVLRSGGAKRAAGSVVKVEGSSCGLAVQGSGWVVRGGIVATNAHVVAGQQDTTVLAPNGQNVDADVVYVDATNDVALLRVRTLAAAPLPVDRKASYPEAVALLGYPRDGPLTATAGTAGAPRGVFAPDAYERGPRPRTIVPLRGRVQPGESGGPVVDRRGRVLAMIFGGSRHGVGGFGVPIDLVLRGLRAPLHPVSSGPCLG